MMNTPNFLSIQSWKQSEFWLMAIAVALYSMLNRFTTPTRHFVYDLGFPALFGRLNSKRWDI